MSKTPQYRIRKGYTQAIVTLTDAKTKKRRDYWLGESNTPESREKYHVLIAAWEANRRCFPDPTDPTSAVTTHSFGTRTNDLQISEKHTSDIEPISGMRTFDVQRDTCAVEGSIIHLMRAYWTWAKTYYRPQEYLTLKIALRVLKQFYGTTPVSEFGPKKLRIVRESMIRGEKEGPYPRDPWSRSYINHQCRRIRQMFKWAASHELADASIYQALCTMEPLKKGRTVAREGTPIGPVSMEEVDAIRPFISRQVAALIDLQLLTGARGGELLKIRGKDIDTTSDSGVWSYCPQEHKMAYQGKSREILFGPEAQKVLAPFMADRPVSACLFRPSDAVAERIEKLHALRKTPLSCGNSPGTNRVALPQWSAGDYYTSNSYLQAIVRGCDLAFPPPPPLCKMMRGNGKLETQAEFMERLTRSQKEALKQWKREHRWHPHQLRHTAATNVRKKFGLEAAQLLLGHSSAQVTDAIYAERDSGKLEAIAKQVG